VQLKLKTAPQRVFMVSRFDGVKTHVVANSYYLDRSNLFIFSMLSWEDLEKRVASGKVIPSVFDIHRKFVMSVEEIGAAKHTVVKSRKKGAV
jgi:hypothetical protein